MRVAKRDWIFLAVIIAVLGVLLLSRGKEKPKKVPDDDKHAQFYKIMNKGGDRMEAEKGCTTCHASQKIPLPKGHPPKEQCLICHMLSQINT
jgi:hypothetical protein